MAGKKEVEIKVSLSKDDVEKVEKQVFREDFSSFTETDTYFTSPVRDFMETKECLRIRQRNGNPVEMTYKGKTTDEMREKNQFWKEEIDLPVSSLEDSEQLLLAIGCEKLVKVEKERKKAMVDGKTITLDRVKDTGYFLEVESEAVEKDVEEALEDNKAFLKELGLDGVEVVRKPYRDLVMDARGMEY